MTETSALAERTPRKVLRRLMPFLMLTYLLAYVDRANLSVAKLQMARELGFDDATIGFGAGIFFIGYLLLEIPGGLIVERWSARKWIARIMVSWGVMAALCGLIGTRFFGPIPLKLQFYGMRFLLGAAEAGFFPGIIVYLSHWFRAAERTEAKALFMVTQPLALLVGVPLSRWLMELVGWRWLFVVEGFPSVLFGFVTLWYLTDRPREAHWLSENEREWLESELDRERVVKLTHRGRVFGPHVLLLVVIYFLIVAANQGFVFFLPSLVEQLGNDLTLSSRTLLTGLPYLCGVFGILLFGYSAFRRKELRWHTALAMILNAAALALLALSGTHIGLAIAGYALVGLTLQAYLPSFWAVPTLILGGSTAAVAIGLINSVGNLGGFIGPLLFGQLSQNTGNYRAGLWMLAALTLGAGLCSLAIPRGPLSKPER